MSFDSGSSASISPFLIECRNAQLLEEHNLPMSAESHRRTSCATIFVVEDNHTGLVTIGTIPEADTHLVQDIIRQCGMKLHKLYLHPSSQHTPEVESIIRDLLQSFRYTASTCCCGLDGCEKFNVSFRHAVSLLQLVNSHRIEVHEIWRQLTSDNISGARTYCSGRSSLLPDICHMSSRYTSATRSSSLRPWTGNLHSTTVQYFDIPISSIEEALQQVGSRFGPGSDPTIQNEISSSEAAFGTTDHIGEDSCYYTHAMLDSDIMPSSAIVPSDYTP